MDVERESQVELSGRLVRDEDEALAEGRRLLSSGQGQGVLEMKGTLGLGQT